MKALAKVIEPLQMILIKQRKKFMLVVMTGLVITSVVLLLLPLSTKFYKMNLESRRLKAEIDSAEYDQHGKGRVDQAFTWSKTRLVLDEYQIAHGDVSRHMETFAKLAKDTGVRLIAMQPMTNPPKARVKYVKGSPYSYTYYQISANAGYFNLRDFIAQMEMLEFFMEIVDLEILANEDTPHEHDLNVTVRMLQRKQKALSKVS